MLRQGGTQHQFRTRNMASWTNHAAQLTEYLFSKWVEVENAIDQGDIDRRIGEWQLLGGGAHKRHLRKPEPPGGTSCPVEHALTKIDSDHATSSPHSLRCDEAVQTGTATQIDHVQSVTEGRLQRNARHTGEGSDGFIRKCAQQIIRVSKVASKDGTYGKRMSPVRGVGRGRVGPAH